VTDIELRRDGDTVEIVSLDDCTVAHLPANDDAWITGWVEVPR
jgi:hypothetical protein